MFDKIKDFLYDISDIFVSLLIIGVIFFAVSWKISDTLSVDINAPVSPTTEAVETTEASIVVTPVTPETSTDSETVTSTEATTEAVTQPATEATTEAATQAATQAPQNLVLENFVVSDGELGYTIGENLEAQGFVHDADDFVQRLIEMGYDSKLRAGTFKLDKRDSLDVIIKVLAGEKR
ncbi:MAG TPA: hypothetical protein VLS94_08705 [Fusibacter sp.]|nr:hypothetical protein [Fusibacter sp.]